MNTINPKHLTMYDELAMRANLNFSRLEAEKYWPETIFSMDLNSWPADWEGRTMLAQTMLAQTTGRTPAFLGEILAKIPEHLNEKGYLGPVYPEGYTHEQAMSGHSWMIRALVEYYNWKRESESDQAEKAMKILKSIINNLYLPQINNYKNYPTTFEERYNAKKWILSEAVDPNWKKAGENPDKKYNTGTSDVGCAFIAIDGATAAYELLQTEALKSLIENMITSFAVLPFEELCVQTHATLSGIRGVLRWYQVTGEAHYLELAIRTFDLYKTKAWTDHYANYNWFGLPRWTEPCAIIDSFIVSQELWEITANTGYLKDAHHILYNAIAHAQRANGAFGTDQCVGAKIKQRKEVSDGTLWESSDQAILFARSLTYEVFWCCNMRGGDGLSRAALYTYYSEADTIIIPFYHSSDAVLNLESGTVKLQMRSHYPFSGNVSFTVKENNAGRITMKLFVPAAWTSGADSRVLLNGKALSSCYENNFLIITGNFHSGDIIELESEMKFYTFDNHECINNSKDHFSFRHGPMMLGVKTVVESEEAEPEELVIQQSAAVQPLGDGRYTIGGHLFQPMWGKENMIEPLDVFQILFDKEK
jgi:uncharacterized protein